jgi:hypothetical protein
LNNFNIYKEINIIKFYWGALISTLVYDAFWFYIHETGVFRRDFDEENSALQKLCFYFSFLNFIAKACLTVLLSYMTSRK